jgi:heme A synthase
MTTATDTGEGPLGKAAQGFGTYAWILLGYLVFVIVFGAWVRITGSGAGCGDHWPLCQGEVVPRAPRVQTIIEFSHRLTSGLLGPMCLAIVVWAFLGAGKRAVLRRLSLLVTFFVVVEALVGRALVKGRLVADDDSVARAVVIALHLGNTLLLTGSAAVLAWVGSGHAATWPRRGAERLALFAIAVVSMAGAVTALGDTLFPVSPASDGGIFAHVQGGLDAGSHFLVRLRAVHPLLAAGVASWLLWRSGERSRSLPAASDGARLFRWLHALLWLQLLAGVATVSLSAPGWLQLVHLSLAQAVWIALVLCSVAAEPNSVSAALHEG